MLQVMPIDKQSFFVNIDNWQEFKTKLIHVFGNTDVFQHEALKQFNQLDQPMQTRKEIADQLVPRVG